MLLITFEGIDGSGKSTIAKLLKKKLINKKYDVILTREPGGNEISEKIRKIVLNKKYLKIEPWTETLLYIAACNQNIQQNILFFLKQKKIVICDRFVDSTLVYQGYAQGLGIKKIKKIQNIILNIKYPNITFFLDISIKEAQKRIKLNINNADRIDLKKQKFHEKVYKGYKILINKFPQRIKVINAHRKINIILEEVYFYIKKMLFNSKK